MEADIRAEIESLKHDISTLSEIVRKKIGEEGGSIHGELFVNRGQRAEEAVNVSQLVELEKRLDKADATLQDNINDIRAARKITTV